MNAGEMHRRNVMHEIERNIREHCLFRIVKNDGKELMQLLKDVCSATEAEHVGNFMFAVKTRRVGQLLISAEPLGDAEEYIRITGYRISP